MTMPYLLPDHGRAVAPRDWTALAEQVRLRRRALHLRQNDLRDRGGPSASVVQSIEQCKRTDVSRRTLRRVDRALAWPEGTCEHLLDGGTVTAPQPVVDNGGRMSAVDVETLREVYRLAGDLAGRLATLPSTPSRDALRAAAVELLRGAGERR
ncbi:immunity repressor [Microcystis phage Mwe-JY05]